MRITISQMNPVIGDFDGNLSKMDAAIKLAKDSSDLIIFPELSLIGYPPLDLLNRSFFLDEAARGVGKMKAVSKKYGGIGIIFGAPRRHEKDGTLRNSAYLVENGKILLIQDKTLLPTYDVFDEDRYFEPSEDVRVVKFKGETLGISICEDMWYEEYPHYERNPISELKKKGATLLINISASPFHMKKESERFRLVESHARRHGLPFVFVNQVGANDELIFDGNSMVVNRKGKLVKMLNSFSEDSYSFDTSSMGEGSGFQPKDEMHSLMEALKLGVSDYVRKCGFSKVIIGISGGIDSAVTAAIATESLGGENVLGITMPSEYSSTGSVKDSEKLAGNLDFKLKTIAIKDIFRSYISTLREHFEGRKEDVAEENIQARIRGNILMALSNKFGYLLLSTGNKSEMSVGYCTLYGDMSGGLSVISDLPKTTVYRLAEYINKDRELIPKEIIRKAPSAELRPDQKDQDSLPEYDVLDEILGMYIEKDESSSQITRKGFDRKTVEWVLKAIKRTEYKRRQSPPGLKVTKKAFGMGRRMPIASRY